MSDEEEREQQGIQAIIFLQSMAGITETTEKARQGWRSLSPHEQEFTLKFHKTMKPNE